MDGSSRTKRMTAALGVVAILGACTTSPGSSATPGVTTPGSEPSDTAAPSAVASPNATPSPLPSATAVPGVLGSTWRAFSDGPQARAVTAGGPGWVAVGQAGDATPMAAAWTSADGSAWARSASVAIAGGAGDAEMTLVTNGPMGLIAAGSSFGDVGPTGIVWQSSDGSTWDVIGSGSLFDLGPCPAGCASLRSIAAGPAGIVVAGYRVVPDGSRFRLEADFWASSGGPTWERVAAPAPSGSTDVPAAELALIARGSGFLAVGSVCDAQRSACRAVAWTSANGRSWNPPVNLPDGAGARALQVAAAPSATVILGMRCTDSGCRTVVWGSADGVSWKEGKLVDSYVEGSTELAAAGETFVVVTSTSDSANAWTSTDGLAWVAQDVDPGLAPSYPIDQILDLAGRSDSVLAIGLGADSSKAGTQFGAWVSP